MRDLPHHMKKLNRRIIRSVHREEMEEETNVDTGLLASTRKQTEQEQKKIEKRQQTQERLSRTPTHLSADERNRKMKQRVPVFDRNNALPRTAKPTRKKTPRI